MTVILLIFLKTICDTFKLNMAPEEKSCYSGSSWSHVDPISTWKSHICIGAVETITYDSSTVVTHGCWLQLHIIVHRLSNWIINDKSSLINEWNWNIFYHDWCTTDLLLRFSLFSSSLALCVLISTRARYTLEPPVGMCENLFSKTRILVLKQQN